MTGWEIMMKPKLGMSAADVQSAIREMGAQLLPIRFRHLNELASLPYIADHRDPFDRMIIAQALAESLPVMTSDARFEEYSLLRVIW